MLLANYNGTPSKAVSVLGGIMGRVAPSTQVLYARGSGLIGTDASGIAGDEVVQLYLTDAEASVPVPLRSLVGFRRLSLQPGESATVPFTVSAAQMAAFDDRGRAVLEPGEFVLAVGGGQPQAAGNPGRTGNCLEARFQLLSRDRAGAVHRDDARTPEPRSARLVIGVIGVV